MKIFNILSLAAELVNQEIVKNAIISLAFNSTI